KDENSLTGQHLALGNSNFAEVGTGAPNLTLVAAQLPFKTTGPEGRSTFNFGIQVYKDPVLTSDGQRVGFLSMTTPGAAGVPGSFQVYLMNLDGSGLEALTADPDGVSQFTLSDGGQNAWYVSNTALYQVNVPTHQVQQRIPPSGPAFASYSPSPGSAIVIMEPGLAITRLSA
ncbi:MAG TPA: hypothetical protein VKV17_16125, partial [Bryobacteraceae bacterium]|nr:hypothetical protein [Bryobacteraceae bacterium]